MKEFEIQPIVTVNCEICNKSFIVNENIVTITGNDKDLILCDEHSYIEKIYNDDTPFYCLEELGPDDREYYYDEDIGQWVSEDEY